MTTLSFYTKHTYLCYVIFVLKCGCYIEKIYMWFPERHFKVENKHLTTCVCFACVNIWVPLSMKYLFYGSVIPHQQRYKLVRLRKKSLIYFRMKLKIPYHNNCVGIPLILLWPSDNFLHRHLKQLTVDFLLT